MFGADRRLRDRRRQDQRTRDTRQYGALAVPSRTVVGGGPYTYTQFADGSVTITKLPSGQVVNMHYAAGHPTAVAINRELTTLHGAFPAPSPAGDVSDQDINEMIRFQPGAITSDEIASPTTRGRPWSAGVQAMQRALRFPLGASEAEHAAWDSATPAVEMSRKELRKSRKARKVAVQSAALEQMGFYDSLSDRVVDDMFGGY